MAEWKLVFYSMAVTTLFSGIFFLVFGSGNAQKWGLPSRPAPPEIKIEDDEVEVDEDGNEKIEELRRLRRASHVGSVVLDLLN
jgi:hypothetical protein